MKPTVHYADAVQATIKVGQSAAVYPIDHPNPFSLVNNKSWVHTSKIVSVDPDTGVFETLNTRYVPAKQ